MAVGQQQASKQVIDKSENETNFHCQMSFAIISVLRLFVAALTSWENSIFKTKFLCKPSAVRMTELFSLTLSLSFSSVVFITRSKELTNERTNDTEPKKLNLASTARIWISHDMKMLLWLTFFFCTAQQQQHALSIMTRQKLATSHFFVNEKTAANCTLNAFELSADCWVGSNLHHNNNVRLN